MQNHYTKIVKFLLLLLSFCFFINESHASADSDYGSSSSCKATASSTDIPKTISPTTATTITSTINIAETGIIEDINLTNLNITHTYIDDIIVTLISPNNTAVILLDKPCNSENDIQMDLDDEATAEPFPCPPINGQAYQPNNALSAFDGEQVNGTWTLSIQDVYGSLDGGSLNGWGLEISVVCQQVEICNNGIDDDGDGLVDNLDDYCISNSFCQGTKGENIFSVTDFSRVADGIHSNQPNATNNPGVVLGNELPVGATNYTNGLNGTFGSLTGEASFPDDGHYVIANNTGGMIRTPNPNLVWWDYIEDNSPHSDGYMMIVNADYAPGIFYQETITGLCPNTTYEFSTDVINLWKTRYKPYGSDDAYFGPPLVPNLAFIIAPVGISATDLANYPAAFSTGDIINNGNWQSHGFSFTTGPNTTDFVLAMRNNAPGGEGNDIAIDNISFSTCGPSLLINNTTDSICSGATLTINGTVGSGYSNPVYQWQTSLDDGNSWQNIIGANAIDYSSDSITDGQQFRLVSAESGNIENSLCRIISNVEVIKVIVCPEICDNGIDDDGDGNIDCEDNECGQPEITEVNVIQPNSCQSGQIRIIANGANLIYSINGGATYQPYPIFPSLAAGAYQIRVKNYSLDCYDDYGAITLINERIIDAVNDTLESCPGRRLTGRVSINDVCGDNCAYTIIHQPSNGTAVMELNGAFEYSPSAAICGNDIFTYQLCNITTNCCKTATVTLLLTDNTIPTLVNIPADETISCDEQLPSPPLVSALDNCPSIAIDIKEQSTQGEDGCAQHHYTLTRTWTATDVCGNTTSDEQVIEIQDITAPDIYRIYTLPNGKKMVAGTMENVSQRWKTISLPIDFSSKPLIFSQVVTTNESTPVISRIRNVSVSQFELRLQEEEAEDGVHLREHVAWVALESGVQSEDFPMEVNSLNLSSNWKALNFSASFVNTPSFISNMQTTQDSDPAIIQYQNLSEEGTELIITEETALDIEQIHANEKVGYLAIKNNSLIKNNKGENFGETGTIDLTSNWQTIPTKNTYYNPIIIAGMTTNNEVDPITVRIRNIGENQFDIRLEEWAYLDGNHGLETVSYLIVEGTVPLASSIICEEGTDGLILGKDWVAIDNCDPNVVIDYKQSKTYEGATTYIHRSWAATDECGNTTTLNQTVTCEGVALQIKGTLQGALLGNSGNNLMRDDLRKKGLLPLEEPYSKFSQFTHYGEGGGEKVAPSMFEIDGANGIVDWVFIELRDANEKNKVIATCSGLMQCDGDIVDVNGNDTIKFRNVLNGDYYVSLRHRNHLGLLTSNTYTFLPNQIPFVDLTYPFTPVLGEDANIEVDGQKALWSGDLNHDGRIIYQGPNNDIFFMLLEILLDDGNKDFLPNFINRGYTEKDFNLDGSVIYQGPSNDRAHLLFNTILKHPQNQSKFSNFIIQLDTP